jgi:hypothetical protein
MRITSGQQYVHARNNGKVTPRIHEFDVLKFCFIPYPFSQRE